VSDPGVKVVFIKKKAKGHGHHGGAWKVAYADFVTAMMALFIVLWLLTQSDQASKEKIAEYFRTGKMPGGALVLGAPGGSNPPLAVSVFPNASGSAAVEARELKQLAEDIEKLLGRRSKNPEFAKLAKHVKVRVVNEGALIELVEGGDNFLFDVASSNLKPGVIKFLEELAPLFKNMPNKVEIHGHTDARPFSGSKKTNWELSFERADQARRVLEGKGIEHGKVQSVLAHADTALYNPSQPYAPENRRLSILLVRSSAQKTRAGVHSDLETTKDAAKLAAPGAHEPNAAEPLGAHDDQATSTHKPDSSGVGRDSGVTGR
jgi:chemotaxis protein MotB